MTLTLAPGRLTVACLGAHPDDIEIGCGGTLLWLRQVRELSVSSLVLTGTPERRCEARAAAEAFAPSAAVEFGDEDPDRFGDGYLPESWGDVKRRVHAFAATTPPPQLIFAPRVDDAHQDHRLLGRLAATVWRNSLVLHYEIPKWDGDLGQPNVYLPLTGELARSKVDLLNASYPSQHDRDWWDDELFLGFMRVRGVECKSAYAEAFTANKIVLN